MKKALKLALEALWTTANPKAEEAITAIKAALAQPAQEPVAWMREDATLKFAEGKVFSVGQPFYTTPPAAQPAQEPVAWLDEEEKIIYWHNTHETDDYHGFRRTTPLYTTPQQRPWVGLTFAEICDAEVIATDEFNNFSELKFARAIEAKLKETNT